MINQVKIGSISIGGNNKIAIQSMTTTRTSDVERTISQIKDLVNAGCDIVRVAIVDSADAIALKEIKMKVSVPIVADIHFDYKLALLSMENGADKVRVNPGNLGEISNFIQVIDYAKKSNTAVRIGVNSGSISREILSECDGNVELAMIKSMLNYLVICKQHNFENIVLSIKSSSVAETVRVNRQLAKLTDFPLHIGVTEAGSSKIGIVKSSIAIGSLLLDGIGSTIRVSLTDDPVEEIYAAKKILHSLKMMPAVNVVSCPTCGRCNYDLFSLVTVVEDIVKNSSRNIKVAVMGCVVNGPGEARDADLGIAGGKDNAVIFRQGSIVATLPIKQAEEKFIEELKKLI